MSANFQHLRSYDEQLFRLGSLAERYFPEDPNTALLKLRQLGERLAQHVASRFGIELRIEETQQQLVQRLAFDGVLDREVAELFHVLRRKGNLANHELQGDHASALKTLRIAWQLGVWFHRTFSEPDFRSGPFVPPRAPAAADQELQAELEQLRLALAQFQAAEGQAARELQQQLRRARPSWSRPAASNRSGNSWPARRKPTRRLCWSGWRRCRPRPVRRIRWC